MKTVYDWRPTIDDIPTRKRSSFPDIVDPVFWELYDKSKPYSMLHVTGFMNLYNSMKYICNRVDGDLVECGNWFGGAAIFMGLCLEHFGFARKIWMLDTFSGFPVGQSDFRRGVETRGPRYPSFLEGVKANVSNTLRSTDHIEFVEGDVAHTIPRLDCHQIALLRLDTDFYVSTKVELDYLYPKLSPGGVLIVDDYGTYDGSRKATDEYLENLGNPMLLNRIDASIWTGIKP